MEQGREVDRRCDLFEGCWQAGGRPKIEDYVSDTLEPMRSALLGELLALELAYRQRLGEAPGPAEYQQRFPHDAPLVEAVFGSATPLAPLPALPQPPSSGPAAAAATLPALLPGKGLPGAGTPFADYQLLDILGRGGMGVVYRARQRSADRLVALKLIRLDHLVDLPPERQREWLDRFRSEGQTAARLAHDHIVTVYEIGESGGQPFYSMRYLDGPSLAEVLRQGPLPGRRAAALLEPVARAVQHAHECGILHRDLKPGNILLDGAGRPFVADFGLAKWTADARPLTQPGAVLGSPLYMPPEQVRDSSRVTEASDVYSLGATLYELLTGRPPFQAATPLEILQLVLDQEPVPPRQLNPAVGRDLETITLKCLHKEPGRRYRSAAELADDLRRYVEGRPVQARPVGPAERLWRWSRRQPLVASLSVAVAFLILATGAVLLLAYGNTSAARHEAEKQRDVARTHLQAWALSEARRLGVEPGRRQEVLQALRQAAALAPGLDLRHEYLRWLDQPDLQPVLALPAGPSDCLPLGDALVFRGQGRLRRVEAAAVVDYDLAAGRASPLAAGAGQINWPWALSPDGALLAARRQDRRDTGVWDLDAGNLRGVLKDDQGGSIAAICLAFSDRCDRLAAAYEMAGPRPGLDRRYRVCVYDARSLQPVSTWSLEAPGLDCLRFHPAGELLAASTGTPTNGQPQYHVIRLWSLPDGKDSGTLRLEPWTGWDDLRRAPRRIAFSSDGRFLAAVQGSVKLWDLQAAARPAAAREVLARSLEGSPADTVSVAPDGRWLMVRDRQGELKMWDAATSRLAIRARPDLTPGGNLAEAGDVPYLVASISGGEELADLRLWQLQRPLMRWLAPPPGAPAGSFRPEELALTCSPDGRWLAYGLGSGTSPSLLDLSAAGAALVPLQGLGPGPLAFSADGGLLWAAAADGQQWTWRLPALQAAVEPGQRYLASAFDAQGRRTAARLEEVIRLRVVALDTGEEQELIHEEPAIPEYLFAPRFSPDGACLLAARRPAPDARAKITVWDSARGRPLYERGDETGLAFFQGLRPLALSSPEALGLRDLEADRPVKSEPPVTPSLGQTYPFLTRFVFSEDGRLCAETGLNGEMAIWDLTEPARAARAVLTRVSRRPSSRTGQDLKAFNRDGSRLAAYDGSDTLKVWDTRTGAELGWLALDARPELFAFGPDDRDVWLVYLGRRVEAWRPGEARTHRIGDLEDLAALERERQGWWRGEALRIAEAVRLSDNRQRLVYLSGPDGKGEGTVCVWELPGGRLTTRAVPVRGAGPARIALSPDAGRLAVLTSAGVLKVGAVGAGAECLRLEDRAWDVEDRGPHQARLARHFCLGPEGSWCAWIEAQSEAATARVFDVPGRRELFSTPVPLSASCVALSERSGLLAVGKAAQVHLYDVRAGSQVAVLEGHQAEVTDLALDPSGQLLASVSAGDGTVRLWLASRGELLAVWQTVQQRPARVTLGPAGRWLATLDSGGGLCLWDVDAARRRLHEAGLDWK
jgi:WD40 repeat protein